MFQTKTVLLTTRLVILLLCLLTVWRSASIQAQTDESISQLKQRVTELTKQTKYTEALPLVEKLVVMAPDDAEAYFQLGFALIGTALNTKDGAARKALRVRARNAFIRAKELDIGQPVVAALIESLPSDGADGPAFSQNIAANALMVEAEGFFAQGKSNEALKDYQKALELDPTLYHAALFSGDVYMQKEDYDQAQVWYQKAITIDPTKETAYRYSATPFMKQKNFDRARDRYVEAFIVEPYNKFARAGLIQWAQVTKTNLGNPKIDIPTNVTFDEKGDAKIDLDASALLGGKDDGSFAWITYGGTRSLWRKEKFAKTFPNEQAYRHSLAEEADALRSVINAATADKKVKNLSPSLMKLRRLNDEGLLEAYILVALADEGISRDHPAYLRANREKLRGYVVAYILTGGGQ